MRCIRSYRYEISYYKIYGCILLADAITYVCLGTARTLNRPNILFIIVDDLGRQNVGGV